MADSILIADDLAERTQKGRLRSRLVRDNAIEFAKKMKLNAELLYVKDLSPKLFKKKQFDLFLEEFEDIKESLLTQFEEASVKGIVQIKSGSPAEEILNYLGLSDKYSLLAMATHGKKGLTKMLLGSVAEEVLRNSPVPVLLLGPTAQEKKAVLKISPKIKVLLLTDLSDSSVAAEKWARKFCQDTDCSATLFHSVGDQIMKIRTNLYGSGYIPFNMDKMFKDMIEEAQRNMDRKVRIWKREGVEVTPILASKEEPIENTFQTQMKKNFDLIVMGTHGRSQLLASFIGSTARKIIQTSPVPLVIVRSMPL